MLSQLRSELIKLVSTRTFYGLVAGAAAVAALSTWSTVTSAGAATVSGELHTQQFFLLASINLALFTIVLGIRAFTDEFRFATIVPSILATGRRGRIMAAKAVIAGVGGAALAAVAQAVMVGLALLLTSGSGNGLSVSAVDLQAMAGLAGAAAVWAALGVAVGALVRHQVAAIVGGIIWVLVVENLGAGLVGNTGQYLPGQAGHALAQAPVGGDALSIPLAAAVLATYVVSALGLARMSLVRRDV